MKKSKKKIDILNEHIISAGFGGQGIMSLGKLISRAAIIVGKNVTWIPSYGAEVRGGTAHCMVRVSDREIESPIVDTADTCIVMNNPSYLKFIGRVNKGGIMLADSSLVGDRIEKRGIKQFFIPATETAVGIGDKRAANMVMAGAYMRIKRIFPRETVFNVIENMFKDKRVVELNKEAVLRGESFIDE